MIRGSKTCLWHVLHTDFFNEKIGVSLALLGSIIENGTYDREDVLLSYMSWANLPKTMLGKNTRALFKGVKTVKGYEKRFEKLNPITQSNGSLMRCSSLILLKDYEKYSDIDVPLTNNNDINRQCNKIYLNILRFLIFNESLNLECIIKEIRDALDDAINNRIRDLTGRDKGWVVHALYVVIYCLKNIGSHKGNSFQDSMDLIANTFFNVNGRYADSDTIAAISGAILGALYGYKLMKKEKRTSYNIEAIDKFFENSERNKVSIKKLLETLEKL